VRRWSDIRTAPYQREVEVRIGSRAYKAILRKDASLDEDERPCDQWQATTDCYPRCWSDGACWDSNADEIRSAQPEAWREVQPC
jgi:hypothetical protein